MNLYFSTNIKNETECVDSPCEIQYDSLLSLFEFLPLTPPGYYFYFNNILGFFFQ